jgi:hypothetical protein
LRINAYLDGEAKRTAFLDAGALAAACVLLAAVQALAMVIPARVETDGSRFFESSNLRIFGSSDLLRSQGRVPVTA